jgi:hypothetical protein
VRRVLGSPLVLFLLIGAALLAVRSWWDRADADGPRPHIVVTAADVERLRAEWMEEHGGPPGLAAEASLVREAIDDEVLYREALAAGVGERDPATRERLVRLGGFLSEEGTRGRAALERQARGLGLERSDIVIRRHLVEMMRLAAAKPSLSDIPGEAELQAWLDAHASDFKQPATIRLTHVYLSGEAHGATAEANARHLLDELRMGVGPNAAEARGDPFIRGMHVGPTTAADLDRIFGDGFARALADLPTGTWVGPVRSSYGLHLVWIEEHVPARLPSLAEVRNQVVLRVLRERGAKLAEERMRVLRARYDVEVERPSALSP